MSILDLFLLLLVAAVAGAVSQGITGYSAGGCLADVAMGFIGALVGTWIARGLGLPELLMLNIGGTSFPFIWSIIGGASFLAILRFLVSRPRSPQSS